MLTGKVFAHVNPIVDNQADVFTGVLQGKIAAFCWRFAIFSCPEKHSGDCTHRQGFVR